MLYWLKNAGIYDYVPFNGTPQSVGLSTGTISTIDMTTLTDGGRRYPVMLLQAVNNGTSDNTVDLADLLEFSGVALLPYGDYLLGGTTLAKQITIPAGEALRQIVVYNNKYRQSHDYYVSSSDVTATLYYVGYLNKD